MPTVALTDYEMEHALLPPVCARCGRPATGRLELKLRIFEGWRNMPAVGGLLFGLFFFPPVIMLTLRLARTVRLRVPHCREHRREHYRAARRSLRFLLPTWTAAALVLDVSLVVETAIAGTGISCFGLLLVLIIATITAALIEHGLVLLSRPRKSGLRLNNVHPKFVAALIEERARDRVDNPDRRDGFGDVRDDYDDGPD
jgi:hypothetical protein